MISQNMSKLSYLSEKVEEQTFLMSFYLKYNGDLLVFCVRSFLVRQLSLNKEAFLHEDFMQSVTTYYKK